jgi:glycosyltransferase involved in cell wall biosynthesis
VERTLSAFDVFVLPSASEGLSNTILEAMATGLPVVATSVGGADEIVADGRTGLLVPPGDPGALASAMEALARHAERRLQFGREARRSVESSFSIARMVSGYTDMYLDVVRGRAWNGGDASPAPAVPATHGGSAAR